MEQKIRKQIRLKNYDYASNGAYFITICTEKRRNIFGVVKTNADYSAFVNLSHAGRVVERAILEIPLHYPLVYIDHYVVMPNHVHILLRIDTDCGRAMHAPTASRVIQQMKGIVTKQLGGSIWQKSFYDEIVRSEQDYLAYWNYIEGNPSKWAEDKYFSE